MALIKNLTLDNGINLPQAYIKIISCNYINGYHVVINVAIYKDKDARINKKLEVVKFVHNCTTVEEYDEFFSLDVLNQENVNIISQSYLWLKEKISFYSESTDDFDLKE